MTTLREGTIIGLRAEIDKNLCVLSAYCTKAAPGLFRIEEGADTASTTFQTVDDPEQVERAYEAEAVCPTGAVVVDEA